MKSCVNALLEKGGERAMRVRRIMNTDQRTGQEEDMKNLRGVTLLELLMVVVVIGILSAVALPQFLKTQERARMSEALTILGAIRGAEIRYYVENNTYTGVTTELDLGVAAADLVGIPAYDYSVAGATAGNFVAVATRNAVPSLGTGCVASYTVRLNRAGLKCGTDCQTKVLTCS